MLQIHHPISFGSKKIIFLTFKVKFMISYLKFRKIIGDIFNFVVIVILVHFICNEREGALKKGLTKKKE